MVGTGGVYCRLGVWSASLHGRSRVLRRSLGPICMSEELRFYRIRGVNVNVHTRVVLSLTPLVMVAPPESPLYGSIIPLKDLLET